MNALVLVAVPKLVVSATVLAIPASPAGVTIVSDVAVFVSLVATTPSTVTEVAPDKFVPVMTVLVPPAVGPEVTESEVIVGALAWAGVMEMEEKLDIRRMKMVDEIDLFLHFRLFLTLERIKSSLKEIFSRPVLPEDS